MEKILSVVIPTKNRYSTLIPVVTALLQWHDADYEVVVHDNSDSNEPIKDFLEHYAEDRRLCYYYVKEPLTAPENCDMAIQRATGEYVCFIGDDDGVAHESLALLRWMKTQNIDSAHSTYAVYAWPDLQDKNYGLAFAGQLNILKHSTTFWEKDVYEELRQLLHGGALTITHLPRVYHGFVRKTCLERLYEQTGTFFPGPVPDMSNAVGLVPFVKKHIMADYPFVICGASGHSMAGKGAMKKHHSLLNKEKSLPKETEAQWSNILPVYWSAQTIWAEGALKALDKVGLRDWATAFNLEKNLAACLMYVPDFRQKTFQKIAELRSQRRIKRYKIAWYFFQLCWIRANSLVKAMLSMLLRRRLGMYSTQACADAKEAMECLDSYFQKLNIRYALSK